MWPSKPLPAFKTTSAGKDNDCFLPDDIKVFKVQLEIGDSVGTQLLSGNLVDTVEVMTGEKTQRSCTAIQLNAINSARGPQYAMHTDGVAGTAAYRTFLTIYFATPWVEPRDRANQFGWNLPPGANARIRVKLGAGLVAPVLQGRMYYGPRDGDMGLIEKWFSSPLGISGDANEHTKLPGVKELLQSIHFFPQDGGLYVNELTIKRGTGTTLVDQLTHLENQVSMFANKLFPDTTNTPRFDYFCDEEDPLDAGLGVKGEELTFKTSYSEAADGTIDIVTVVLGKPE